MHQDTEQRVVNEDVAGEKISASGRGYTSKWQDLQRTENSGRTLSMTPTLQLEDGTAWTTTGVKRSSASVCVRLCVCLSAHAVEPKRLKLQSSNLPQR